MIYIWFTWFINVLGKGFGIFLAAWWTVGIRHSKTRSWETNEFMVWHITFVLLTYGNGSIPINTIFSGMNIHLPAILGFTRGTGFWPIPISVRAYETPAFCPPAAPKDVHPSGQSRHSKAPGLAEGEPWPARNGDSTSDMQLICNLRELSWFIYRLYRCL